MSELSDADLLALETIEAMPALAKLGGLLAEVVERALEPQGEVGRVFSCLHILDSSPPVAIIPGGNGIVHSELRALICPMHPEKLLCNGKCLDWHYRHEHRDEARQAKCFVCETPMLDPLTEELHDFTGITGTVTLRQPVKFYPDNRGRNLMFTYAGTLGVLPVAYLCARHEPCVDVPLRMEWPSERLLVS